MKTQIDLSEQESVLLRKLLSLDLDRIGFKKSEQKTLSKIREKIQTKKN